MRTCSPDLIPPKYNSELQHVQERAAVLTAELRQAEAERDTLLRQLVDSEGAHDRHPVAVR